MSSIDVTGPDLMGIFTQDKSILVFTFSEAAAFE